MLNARGEVVGINVALMIDSQNIGFSIPVVLFQILLKQLLDPSRMVVSLPVLGASLQNSTLSIMSFLGLRDEGILATQVAPGFPLHEAGIDAARGDSDEESVGEGYDDGQFDVGAPEYEEERKGLIQPEKDSLKGLLDPLPDEDGD